MESVNNFYYSAQIKRIGLFALVLFIFSIGNSFAQQIIINEGGFVVIQTSETYDFNFISELDNSTSTAVLQMGSGNNSIFSGSFDTYYGYITFEDNSSMIFAPSMFMNMASKFRIGGGSGVQKAVLKKVSTLNNRDETNNTNPVEMDLFGVLDLSPLESDLTINHGNIVFNNPGMADAPKIILSPYYKIIFEGAGCGFTGNMDVSKNFDFSSISNLEFTNNEVVFAKTKREPVFTGTPNTSHLSSDYNYSITKTESGGYWELKLTREYALPVELNSFKATINKNIVSLNWETATERNNYGFIIEKSFTNDCNEINWKEIGFVSGSGNTNSKHNYTFNDEAVIKGVNYYRLKQIDNDGKFTYSSEISAEIRDGVADYILGQNYPNPFNPSCTIEYYLPERGDVILKVYDVTGRETATLVNEEKEAGRHKVEFNTDNLSGGVYFYILSCNGYTESKKMTLLK